MAIDQTFAPAYGRGATASVSSTSASTELGFKSKTICLTNTGEKVCYVRIGISGITATAADYAVLGGSQVTISKFQDDTHIAYVCAGSDSTTSHMIQGEGY